MVNISQTPASPTQVVAAPAAAPAPPEAAPAASAVPAPSGFPARADYVADIPIQGRALTVEISIDGGNAKAYACDNVAIETWLSGAAVDGTLRLTDKTATRRLNGQLRGDAIVGTLWIGERSWEFEATRTGSDYE